MDGETIMTTLKASILGLFLALLGAWGAVEAADQASGSLGDDRFVAGEDVALAERVEGDAFVAGGRSQIDGHVSGDALATGGTVDVRGEVAQDLYAAGGEVRIEALVRGNARVAGGTIYLERSADIAGNATLAGGSVEQRGHVGGTLAVFGGRVRLNGAVDGDVEVASEDIRVGPDAVIGGRLTYEGPSRPEVADSAVITGGIERRNSRWRGMGEESGFGRVLVGVFRTLWFAGVLLTGILLVAVFPGFTREAAATARSDTLTCLGLGLALLLAVPLLALMLFVTIIGIPLGIATLMGYGLLLMLGYLTAALAVGDWLLLRSRPVDAEAAGWRMLFLLVALVAMALLRWVPWVGQIAVFVLFMVGLGAFALRSVRGYRAEAKRG
jgi:cytoskeletal protein CcmA (bactofilin family)